MNKLAQIQKELKAPKSQFNSFGKYAYRSCEDILEAVKPLLDGAVLTINDDIIEVGGRVYVKATATLEDGELKHEVSAMAREPQTKKGMDESQITGAASSYARKYALNGLFCIDDANDSDHEIQESKPDPKTLQAITDPQIKSINSLFTDLKATQENIKVTVMQYSGNRVEQVDAMMTTEAKAMIKALQKARAERHRITETETN